jgi:hypothetical protein
MSVTDGTFSGEASSHSQGPATRRVVRLKIERHGLASRVTMHDLHALPVLLVGRETLRLKDGLKAVPVFDVAHVALWLGNACFLGEVAPVSEIFLDQSSNKTRDITYH